MKYNAFEITKLPYNMLKYFLAFFFSHLTYGKMQVHLILWKIQSRNNIANFYRFIKGDILIIENNSPEIICKNINELLAYNFKHVKQIIKKAILFVIKYVFIFIIKNPQLKEYLQKILKKLKFTDLNLIEQEIYQLLAKK